MAEDSPVTQRRHQGTSRSYILDRLKREKRTAFIDAIEAGRVTALAVAVELGWVKRPPTVGRYMNRARQRQHQLQAIAGDGLSSSQMQELWLGPGERSLFDSREELEQAWHKHRTEIMRLWGSHGRRPMGWWEFDAGDLKHPGYDRERSTLWRAGVLTADEKAELERGSGVESGIRRGLEEGCPCSPRALSMGRHSGRAGQDVDRGAPPPWENNSADRGGGRARGLRLVGVP